MEEGLGSFPIPETADADELLKIRLEKRIRRLTINKTALAARWCYQEK